MLLAHDLGTTGNKASLHDDDGRLLSAITVPYPTRFASNGVAEQDPAKWWRAVCDASRALLNAPGAPVEPVRAVGFSGQMMGATLLDARGRAVRPSMIWADHRSVAQCRQLIERIGMEEGYRITGHRFDPTYTLSKAMWVREHEPEVWSSVRTVCQAKDFMVYKLTDAVATDPSDASSTNAYDQRKGAWSQEILGAADIDPALFPQIVPSATIVGEVTRAAADATGLVPGTPVIMGGGDGPMAAVGVGAVAPGAGAYVYLGSSSWVSVASSEPLLDPKMRTMTFNHVVPGLYVPTATMQAGGASLEWLSELLYPSSGGSNLRELVGVADTSEASGDGLYFLPHLLGERSPYWNPAATGAFVGLQRHHRAEHLMRAVLEGVAFNLGTCVTAFREAGHGVDCVDAIGGGAVSDVWLQIFADVW